MGPRLGTVLAVVWRQVSMICMPKTTAGGSLAEASPETARMLHPERNGELTAQLLTPGSKKRVWWQGDCGHEWEQIIQKQVRSGKCPYCTGRRILQGFNDLASTHPAIADEWHPLKNGDLKPTQVSKGYTKKVWWCCSVDPVHEWESTVNNRTNHGRGCPVCTGQKRMKGVNDLATTHPEVAASWHPVKNGELTPHDVGKGSINAVWWQCELGHEWRVSPNSRVNQDSGCPVCSGQQILPGFNDLAATHGTIAAEWHPVKNGEVGPDSVSAGNNRKYWWLCSAGHEWQAAPNTRRAGHGCPVCANQAVLAGFNDLASQNAPLALQWHPSKNGDLTPEMVTSRTDRKVWWLGPCRHEWEASIGHRARGKGCPVCGGDLIVPGINDLATKHPDLAGQWHPTKNAELTPEDVPAGSNRKVWWLGECGHEWEALIVNRSRLNAGCPFCAGFAVLAGFNDLASKHPEIASEWHPSMNGDLTPDQVTPHSKQVAWWLGKECGHEWKQRILHRQRGHGCTVCWEPWSKAEKQVAEFIQAEFPDLELVENLRGGFMGMLELDIYVPALKLGIEFNGDYWHDESRDPAIRDRHQRKQACCDAEGVRLAVVWERDWKSDQDRVKDVLREVVAGGVPPTWMTLSREDSPGAGAATPVNQG